ncbi:MAG: hypothetical protein R3C56_18000 [Pirellulaceae bacterium]
MLTDVHGGVRQSHVQLNLFRLDSGGLGYDARQRQQPCMEIAKFHHPLLKEKVLIANVAATALRAVGRSVTSPVTVRLQL